MAQPAPGKVIGTPRTLLVPTSSEMFKDKITLYSLPGTNYGKTKNVVKRGKNMPRDLAPQERDN